MRKDAFKIALCCGCIGAIGVTLGHYWERWPIAYFVVMFGSLAIAVAFEEDI